MPSISVYEADHRHYPSGFFRQTVLFDLNINNKDAIKWLRRHNLYHDYYRISGMHGRFMQSNPVIGAQYFSKRIMPGITYVFQKYK